MSVKQATADALLLLAPGCPHCPVVLQALGELVKHGDIGSLEIVNIAVHPERASALGVRSVPWLRLGDFEFEGLHSLGELRAWAAKAGTPQGLSAYFDEQLKSGRLAQTTAMVEAQPERLDALLRLAEDPDTELTVRIGISAVVESFAGKPALLARLPTLQALARNPDPRVRADAAHFLAQCRAADALPALERLLGDAERSVRDVAGDSLEELRATLQD